MYGLLSHMCGILSGGKALRTIPSDSRDAMPTSLKWRGQRRQLSTNGRRRMEVIALLLLLHHLASMFTRSHLSSIPGPPSPPMLFLHEVECVWKFMCHAGRKCYVTKSLLYCLFRRLAGSRQEFHESLENHAPRGPTTSAGSKLVWYTANAR